jgi:hypothetical protein
MIDLDFGPFHRTRASDQPARAQNGKGGSVILTQFRSPACLSFTDWSARDGDQFQESPGSFREASDTIPKDLIQDNFPPDCSTITEVNANLEVTHKLANKEWVSPRFLSDSSGVSRRGGVYLPE